MIKKDTTNIETTDKLQFDPENYSVKTCIADDRRIIYRSWEGLDYCEHPVDEIQKLNLFVPECYYDGVKLHGYSLETAPIFIQSSVGGYLPGPCEWPGTDHKGQINTLFRALEHGYVVASIGVRGRTTGKKTQSFFEGSVKGELGTDSGSMTGKAPALIVDWKAGIRYLRKNKERIPGNTDRIITNGTSAGGAISAMAGASGDHPDYAGYLKEIGAAEASDSVFASSCYCPIHNLEHSDAAYEWMFEGCREFHSMRIEKTPQGMKFTPVSGEMTEEQMQLSKELKTQFPAYINSLHLQDADGHALTLEEDGSGSFAEYVLDQVRVAAPEPEQITDISSYARTITRGKQTPAFDSPELKTPENEEFGTPEIPARHFTEFGMNHSKAGGKMAEATVIRMLNPTAYIADKQAKTAKYWRIRHGSIDRDTSLAIPVILKLLLEQNGCETDFKIPWGIPHRGDYDLDELFVWIDRIAGGMI